MHFLCHLAQVIHLLSKWEVSYNIYKGKPHKENRQNKYISAIQNKQNVADLIIPSGIIYSVRTATNVSKVPYKTSAFIFEGR